MVSTFSNYLQESGLSRIWKHSEEHDYGTITANRYAPDCGEGTPYTKKENQQRNKSLLSKLRAKGYGITAIKGAYIENYGKPTAREVGENSYFVADLQDKGRLKKDLLALGEEFEQDSVIFGAKGKAGVLFGTSDCPDAHPGAGKKSVQGGAIFGKEGEFMSRVKGRPFVFASKLKLEHYGVCKFPTELRGPVTISKMDWRDIPLSEEYGKET